MAFTMHKYYISLTKIEYKKENSTIQITMRIFIDDLQEALNKTYGKNFELAIPDESTELRPLIKDYISNNFYIKINDKLLKYNYLGKEYEKDVVYLYLETQNIEFINSIEVKNSMLTRRFPTQQNFIKIYMNGIKKTFLLSQGNDKDLLKFQ
jgi:hypothetical protein